MPSLPYLVHPLPLNLVAFDVPNPRTHETEDRPTPEVERWLIGNCLGRWTFLTIFGSDASEIIEGEARSGPKLTFGIEFAERHDFELFKQRWQGDDETL